jgi:pimeloyl-ACP methyl ester carboxylesterase
MKNKEILAYKSSLDSFTMKLKDGRTLSWSEQGDRLGEPVVICHGMHQSRLTRHPDEQFAIENHIRIIVPDRPGYGKSDPFDKIPLTEWPNDLAQLMQHLHVEKFSLLGLGLGTIFALKAAEVLAEKINRTTCVSLAHFINPITNCKFLTIAASGACRLAKYSPKLMLHVTKIMGKDIFLKDPISILTNFYPIRSQQDQQALDRKDLQQILVKDFTESNRQGFGKALISELHYLLNNKRIFNPAKITTPVNCWRSKNSQKPTVSEIETFCAELPNGEIHIVKNDNELIIFHEWQKYLLQSAYG